MIFLKENLRLLRKRQGLTQDELAGLLDTKRSLIGSYEEGRGVPKLEMIKRIADFFKVSLDQLLSADLSEEQRNPLPVDSELKVLSVVVTPENDERIAIVPVKASAGYLNGRSDPEYMGSLPNFTMPVAELSQGKSYRVFQIQGDSMLPVPPGSYVFCEYVEDATDIRDGNTYILITANEGMVYKRVWLKSEHEFILKSDNPEYQQYTIEASEILEIWRAKGYLTFNLPDNDTLYIQKLISTIKKLEEELQRLKK